jgi:pimeloyl-ACP methyl ester carboxylesterase
VKPPDLEPFALQPDPGHRIAGERLPGAPPCYLFLHGLGSVRAGDKSSALFAHAAARGRAAVRYDQRGHGDSSGTIGVVTISELIADAALVLDRTGPAVVFGSSLGGLVAAFLAAQRPDAVRGLVLVAPAFGWVRRMRQRLDGAGQLRTSQGLAFPVHARVLADAERLDEVHLPERLPMPVLIVHGSDDDVVPPSLSQRFFAAIPHPRKDFWLVPGGDHRLNREISLILARMDAFLG